MFSAIIINESTMTSSSYKVFELISCMISESICEVFIQAKCSCKCTGKYSQPTTHSNAFRRTIIIILTIPFRPRYADNTHYTTRRFPIVKGINSLHVFNVVQNQTTRKKVLPGQNVIFPTLFSLGACSSETRFARSWPTTTCTTLRKVWKDCEALQQEQQNPPPTTLDFDTGTRSR